MSAKTILPLNFEQALQYTTEQLRNGHSLAQALLNTLDFKQGRFFALLHLLADKTKIHQFQTGGILPLNPLEPISFREKFYPGRKKSNSVRQLAEYLINVMNSNLCCYFEDVVYRKQDPAALQFKENTLYYQEELYLFLKKEDFSIESAMKMINHTDAQWYYLNIISKENPEMIFDITIEKLQKIAIKTTHIVIGAYDMEGFVIWEKF